MSSIFDTVIISKIEDNKLENMLQLKQKEGDCVYKQNFSERIKKARIEAGYTQPQVADELNIPKSSISKYETGNLEPDLEKLASLADFYNVSIDWLLGLGPKRIVRAEKEAV